MQSTFNILEALYQVVAVPAVTSEINGKVLIGSPAKTSQAEDIELKVVENNPKYLQFGKCIVGIHLPTLTSNLHNLTRYSELINLIAPLVADVSVQTAKGEFYFQHEEDEGILYSPERDGMSQYNLIISFQTFQKD